MTTKTPPNGFADAPLCWRLGAVQAIKEMTDNLCSQLDEYLSHPDQYAYKVREARQALAEAVGALQEIEKDMLGRLHDPLWKANKI